MKHFSIHVLIQEVLSIFQFKRWWCSFLALNMFALISRTNHHTLVKHWKHYCKYSTWFLKEQSYNHLQVHNHKQKVQSNLKKSCLAKAKKLDHWLSESHQCFHVCGKILAFWVLLQQESFDSQWDSSAIAPIYCMYRYVYILYIFYI